jgi:alkanesulfonate monooxygenase SsuD/methylene tetrahydromethanopterin reductase-like flavin-dependent oxidoreductase (luciferase family)
VQVGIFMMPLHPPGQSPSEWIEADLEQIQFLDQLGFDEGWIGEHQVSAWEPLTSPEIFMAAALQRTSKIRLGTGVSCLPHHHPVHVANRVSILDHLSRGRINFGIGTAGFHESEVFDLDWRNAENRQVFRDVIAAVVEIWTNPEPGQRTTSRFSFRIPEPDLPVVDYHMRPYQDPHPPIAVACFSPRSDSLTLAAGHGWAPMSINIAPLSSLQANWETYEEGASAAGRTADRSLWRIAREVVVGETSAKARELALGGSLSTGWRGGILPSMIQMGVPLKAITGPDLDLSYDDPDRLLEWFCENVWIVGDVAEVADKLNALYSDVGGFGTLLAMAHPWDEAGAWKQSMTLLHDEILPRLPDVRASSPMTAEQHSK